jgi:hypothetical protein
MERQTSKYQMAGVTDKSSRPTIKIYNIWNENSIPDCVAIANQISPNRTTKLSFTCSLIRLLVHSEQVCSVCIIHMALCEKKKGGSHDPPLAY